MKGLNWRTVGALRAAGITKPERFTIPQLLDVPGIGPSAVWDITQKINRSMQPDTVPLAWPELEIKDA